MKKIVLAVALCLLLLCCTACQNGENGDQGATEINGKPFASSEEMIQYMEGIWAVEDQSGEKTYYLFKEGQVYTTTEQRYKDQVESILDSALQNGGMDGLLNQNFEKISKRLYLSDFATADDTVTFLPENGRVKLREGEYNEINLLITEDAVSCNTINPENSIAMMKVSDTTELSNAHFETWCDEVINSYQISVSPFFMDTAEYGEMIKSTISGFDWWKQKWDGDDIQVYTPNEALTALKDSMLLIAKENLTYVYKVSASTGFAGEEHAESFIINYSPEEGTFNVLDVNKSYSNVYSLIAYGLYAVQDIPGIYTIPEVLYNDMVDKGKKESSDYGSTITMSANGLEYSLTSSVVLTEFEIRTIGGMSLKQLLDIIEEEKNVESKYGPSQSGTLEQLLDGSKNWIAPWEYEGWEYNVYFVFKENGTCYFALGDLELYGAGVGTYTVNNGSELSIKIKMGGKTYSATYMFDPATFSLTVTSSKGLVGKKGEIFYLKENLDNDVEQVESWGKKLK